MKNNIQPFVIAFLLVVMMIGVAETHHSRGSDQPLIQPNECLSSNLSFDPTSHDFGDVYEGSIITTIFSIWNSGCCQLFFQISDPVTWISVCPSGGSSTGEPVPITITIDTEGLATGLYQYDLLITSTGGQGTFHVDINIIQASDPVLFFYPASLDFGDVKMRSISADSFEIWNVGSDTLTYSLSENCDWLAVNPLNGSSTGTHNTITVSINTTNLDYGQYTSNINIDSNGGEKVLPVSLTVVEAKYPVLAFTPNHQDVGDVLKGDTAQTFFEIWNVGGHELQFSLLENYEWVTITPSEGFSTGAHVNISVVINTSTLSLRAYNGVLLIDSNGGGGSFTFTFTVTNTINTPPTIPIVSGKKSGNQGQKITYTCVSTDPNSDRIYYNFSWGDGSFSSWFGPFDSGEPHSASHTWKNPGIYKIKVQAKDSNTTNTKSAWSEPFIVGIDTYLNISVNEARDLLQNTSNGIQIPIDIRSFQLFITEHIDTQSTSETTRWFGEKLFTDFALVTLFKILFNREEVILYSQNGEESNRIAQLLVDHGFSNTVYNLIGGLDAWKNAGLPTVKGFSA